MKTGSEKSEGQTGRTNWWRSFSRQRPPAEELIASSGISFQLWRLYQHFWLVCLLFPFVQLVRQPTSPLRLLVGLSALAFFAGSYTWLMWRHPLARGLRRQNDLLRQRAQLALLVLLVVLASVLSLYSDLSFLWLFLEVSASVGVLLPWRRAFVMVSLLMFFPPVISVLVQGSIQEVDWPLTIALMLLVRALGLDMLGFMRLSSAMGLLHTTRQELARVKVEEERQRFSRDLHDVLGHTLATITLKSELARLLVEEDPARCTQELSEIEGVARTSLRDVREAVAGYRQPRLASELAGAHQLLEAAGIDVRWQIQADLLKVLPFDTAAVLAWTVREGVTNIIRHSRAHHCTLALTQQGEDIRLEVLNDQGQEEPPKSAAGRPGVGLVGLRERVREQSGQMEAGPFLVAGKAHFRLQVALPLPSTRWTTTLSEERS